MSVDVTFLESKSFFEVAEYVPVEESVPLPSLVPLTSTEHDPVLQVEQQASKSLQVYRHRQQPPMPTSVEIGSSSTSADLPYFDLPIVLRKGSRSTTSHLISTFVSYDSLHLSFRHFALSISAESIPNNYQEALHIPH